MCIWHFFLKRSPGDFNAQTELRITLCVFCPTSLSQHTRPLIGYLEPTNKHKQVKPNQHKNKTKKKQLYFFTLGWVVKIFPKTAASLYCQAEYYHEARGAKVIWISGTQWNWNKLMVSVLSYFAGFCLVQVKFHQRMHSPGVVGQIQETNTFTCYRQFVFCLPVQTG